MLMTGATFAIFTVSQCRRQEWKKPAEYTASAIVYVAVLPGGDPSVYSVDHFLVAAKATEDAVIAYHSALEYHGKAHSAYCRIVYVSECRSQTMQFQGHGYVRIAVPYSLRATGNATVGIEVHRQEGVDLRVTNLERPLVEVLDHPDISGSWEEIWDFLEATEFFDLDQAVRYVELLGNATTAAKVGFYLEQNKDTLMGEDKVLESLAKLRPKQPYYMSRNSSNECRLIPLWNLLVPKEIIGRRWEELR